jgi:hypothetical protein
LSIIVVAIVGKYIEVQRFWVELTALWRPIYETRDQSHCNLIQEVPMRVTYLQSIIDKCQQYRIQNSAFLHVLALKHNDLEDHYSSTWCWSWNLVA